MKGLLVCGMLLLLSGCVGENVRRSADQISKFARHINVYGADPASPTAQDNLASSMQLKQMVGAPRTGAPEVPADYDTNTFAQTRVRHLQSEIDQQIRSMQAMKMAGGIGLGLLSMVCPAAGIWISRLKKARQMITQKAEEAQARAAQYQSAFTTAVSGVSKLKNAVEDFQSNGWQGKSGRDLHEYMNDFFRKEAEKFGVPDFGKMVQLVKSSAL